MIRSFGSKDTERLWRRERVLRAVSEGQSFVLTRRVSRDLLATELRRMAVREARDQAKVSAILDGVSLAAFDRATCRSAGLLPWTYLRTLDALQLEAAIRLDADAILTYDHRLADAAASTGLDGVAPGVEGLA